MPHYEYTAVDKTGRQISGSLEADTRDAVLRRLSDQGHFPIDAVERRSATTTNGGFSLFSRAPRPAEITLFTRELALLLAAGQPITRSLSLIEEDAVAPRIQALASRLRTAIASGKAFNEALAAEDGRFPPVFVGMVKAAESSGQLETVLERIADTREREQRLKSKITSALLYPSLLILTAIAAIVLLMILVVPRFKEMLGDQVHRMPAASKAVLAVSDWLTAHAELVGAGAVGLLLLLLFASRQPAVRSVWQRLVFRLPLIGSVARTALTARFCRTLGVLMASGLGLPQALQLTRDVIGNSEAEVLIDGIGLALRQGRDFTEPLAGSHLFPSLVTSLLRIGAESGALADSSLRLADMYENKLETAMQRLVAVLEPTIILLISVFIGFIVLSIMGAIVGVYDLTGT